MMNRLQVSGHTGKKHVRSSGHNTGKAQLVYNTMQRALEIIEERTKENPIAVVVGAIENAAPREEVIAIEYGGARYPKAVEMSPSRRVDFALRQLVTAAATKSFDSKKAIEVALADEIVNAYKLSNQSVAISKKNEIERQADSSR
jgi:small subunit ribosomal protein S7